MRYKNIARRFFGLVTKHACDRQTDRRTDRITTPKTALSIACAVKITIRHVYTHAFYCNMILDIVSGKKVPLFLPPTLPNASLFQNYFTVRLSSKFLAML